VAELAAELGVSERHLRRALRRELGVSPVELALTHRLELAHRLLAETSLPVIDIAFASGFESVRRFNVAFRARFGTSPRQERKAQRGSSSGAARIAAPEGDLHA
jgi:AraC family transcriptional regulator of adaptative response / DNA-3-methyladenine glycosylase II